MTAKRIQCPRCSKSSFEGIACSHCGYLVAARDLAGLNTRLGKLLDELDVDLSQRSDPGKDETMTKEEIIKELDSFGIDESVGMTVRDARVDFYADDQFGIEYACHAYPGDGKTRWEAFISGTEALSEDTAQGLFDALRIWAEENTDA